jgi:hypothetical protein
MNGHPASAMLKHFLCCNEGHKQQGETINGDKEICEAAFLRRYVMRKGFNCTPKAAK